MVEIQSRATKGQLMFGSYGAMTVLFSFLTQSKIIEFQCVNNWMYHTGVGRIQTRLALACDEIYFAVIWGRGGLGSYIIQLDRKSRTQKKLKQDFLIESHYSV